MNLKEEVERMMAMADNKQKFEENLNLFLSSIGGNIPEEEIRAYIGTRDKYFGIRMPDLKIISKHIGMVGRKEPEKLFDLMKFLWDKDYYEYKLIVSRVLELLVKSKSKEILEFMKNKVGKIDNWAICDNLANLPIKKLMKKNAEDVFKMCMEFIKGNKWERRFAIVVFILQNDYDNVLKFASELMDAKEMEVKRAIGWGLKKATKTHPRRVYRLLLKHAVNPDKDKEWIIKDSMQKLSKEMQDEIWMVLNGKKTLEEIELRLEADEERKRKKEERI